MSHPDKPDLPRGWLFVEKLLKEHDAEALDRADDDEVERQMRAAGIEPTELPSAEELLAMAEERAAKRLGHAIGPVKPMKPAAPPTPARRLVRRTWLIAAAIGVVACALVLERRGRGIVAWLRHDETIGPDHWNKDNPDRTPPPQERADRLRNEADVACAKFLWGACAQKLDEAARIDPAGEAAPRVVSMRQAIEAGLYPEGGRDEKPRGK